MYRINVIAFKYIYTQSYIISYNTYDHIYDIYKSYAITIAIFYEYATTYLVSH